MGLEEKLAINEKKPDGSFSICEDVSIGDDVLLLLDGTFYGRPKESSTLEMYSGFVWEIKPRLIGIAVSHPTNKYHGDDEKG